jgi:hypothetical protein
MVYTSATCPPGVPAAGVEGVDHHVLTSHGKHQTGHRARELLYNVVRYHLHDNTFFHQHNNAGDWALGRAGGEGGTELSGIGIYYPRVVTRRGRPGNVRKGKL